MNTAFPSAENDIDFPLTALSPSYSSKIFEENGVKVMRPRNIIGNEFIDYYVIHVSWKAGEVHEDKETDIVYLTVSR